MKIDLGLKLDNTALLQLAARLILPGVQSGGQYVRWRKLVIVPKFSCSYQSSHALIKVLIFISEHRMNTSDNASVLKMFDQKGTGFFHSCQAPRVH